MDNCAASILAGGTNVRRRSSQLLAVFCEPAVLSCEPTAVSSYAPGGRPKSSIAPGFPATSIRPNPGSDPSIENPDDAQWQTHSESSQPGTKGRNAASLSCTGIAGDRLNRLA